MFAGFNLTTSEGFKFDLAHYMNGKTLFDEQNDKVSNYLKAYIQEDKDGLLRAEAIEGEWFPTIDADIFISHSHKDVTLALGLAGWLKNEFDINCFIDSSVWGNSETLLKILDKQYSVSERDKDGHIKTYDYKKRNRTTAHVHVLLNMALQKMIDRTECLFFINSSNSIISPIDSNNNETLSPWIYSELLFSSLVRHRELSCYRENTLRHGLYELSELKIKYKVTTKHLYDITEQDLLSIPDSIWIKDASDALDCLYKKKAIIK